MFGWFGSKSAPEAMACAYAPPAWLLGGDGEGFARGYESRRRRIGFGPSRLQRRR